MQYKIINTLTKASPISQINDINIAHSLLNIHDWTAEHIVVEDIPTPKFKGPFCSHCHSNEHLGINCPDRIRNRNGLYW